MSILLCYVMLLSLLPVSAVAATTYTKAGEIGAVTAECAPIAAPTLGGKVTNSFQVTVISPTDQGVLDPTGDAVRWQRKSGDNSMMYLWIILLCVSGLGVIATTVLGKKRFVK